MKIQYSLPENETFFSRYAALIPTLYKFGYLAQVVQALTEISIVYAVVYSRAVEFSPEIAHPAAAAGAVLIPLLLAVGLRKFLTYSIRAILGRHYSGLDFWMTAIIFAITAALLFASGSLSFHGARDMVEIASPPPAVQNTDQADRRREKEEARISAKYARDSSTLAGTFAAKIQATKALYSAKIKEARLEAGKVKTKEQKAGYWSKIEALKAEQKAAVATLEASRSDALAGLLEKQDNRLSSVLADHRKETGAITAANASSLAKFQQRTNKYGGLLAYFTLFCLGFTSLSITLHEIHRAGSGIKPVALPNQYHFSQGVLEEFSNALSDKFQYHARSLVRKIENSTPAPPLPTAPPALYDLAGTKQARLKVVTPEDETKEALLQPPKLPHTPQTAAGQVITPTPDKKSLEGAIVAYLETALKLAEAKLLEAAQEQELRGEDVIRAYLGDQATPENVNALKGAVIAYLQGAGENPFSGHHRTVIRGFQKYTPPQEPPAVYAMRNNAIRNDVKGGEVKTVTKACAFCGGTFERRTTFQKFCSESCRVKAWENRTGRTLTKRAKG